VREGKKGIRGRLLSSSLLSPVEQTFFAVRLALVLSLSLSLSLTIPGPAAARWDWEGAGGGEAEGRWESEKRVVTRVSLARPFSFPSVLC